MKQPLARQAALQKLQTLQLWVMMMGLLRCGFPMVACMLGCRCSCLGLQAHKRPSLSKLELCTSE
jgi:hypothetical protein